MKFTGRRAILEALHTNGSIIRVEKSHYGRRRAMVVGHDGDLHGISVADVRTLVNDGFLTLIPEYYPGVYDYVVTGAGILYLKSAA